MRYSDMLSFWVIVVGKLASLSINVQFDVDIEIISRISVVSYEQLQYGRLHFKQYQNSSRTCLGLFNACCLWSLEYDRYFQVKIYII